MTKDELDRTKAFINDLFVITGKTRQRRTKLPEVMNSEYYFTTAAVADASVECIADGLETWLNESETNPDEFIYPFFFGSGNGHTSNFPSIFTVAFEASIISGLDFIPTLDGETVEELRQKDIEKYIANYLYLRHFTVDCYSPCKLFLLRLLALAGKKELPDMNDLSGPLNLFTYLYKYGCILSTDFSLQTCMPTALKVQNIVNNYGQNDGKFVITDCISNSQLYDLCLEMVKSFVGEIKQYSNPILAKAWASAEVLSGLTSNGPVTKEKCKDLGMSDEEVEELLGQDNQPCLISLSISEDSSLFADREVRSKDTMSLLEIGALYWLQNKTTVKIFNNKAYYTNDEDSISIFIAK